MMPEGQFGQQESMGGQQGPSQQSGQQQLGHQQPGQQFGGQQFGGQQQGGPQAPVGHTFPTKGHLPEATRQQSIEALNRVLADTTDLLTQVKFAHWNVRGPNFYQLHELFEEIAEELEEQIDEVAERATALGGQAMGTARIAASASNIPEIRTNAVSGPEFVEQLAERFAIHDASLDRQLQRVSQLNDLDTVDILNEVSREVSKFRWFLEAHIITQPTAPGGMAGGQQSGTSPQQFGGSPQQPGAGGQSGTSARPLGDAEGSGQIRMQQGGGQSSAQRGGQMPTQF